MSNYEHIFNPDFHKVGKGHEKLKKSDKVFKINPDKDKGKRKVKINNNTLIYTNRACDDDVIIKEFKEKYNIF